MYLFETFFFHNIHLLGTEGIIDKFIMCHKRDLIYCSPLKGFKSHNQQEKKKIPSDKNVCQLLTFGLKGSGPPLSLSVSKIFDQQDNSTYPTHFVPALVII